MQRHLGLHLSALKPALVELAELGEPVDFFGDKACNDANHNRRHNGALRGWHDAIAAVATTQTVLGDKENGAKTKQFNDFNNSHVVDIAEIGAGDGGEDVCNEVKCFGTLKKSGSTGRGGVNGGTAAKVWGTNTSLATRRSSVASTTWAARRAAAQLTGPSTTRPARAG